MKKLLAKVFRTTKRNTITPFTNGPLHITGSLVLKDANDKVIEKTKELFLCRCGNSNHKPYCDGQHKKAGYQDNGEFKKLPVSESKLVNKGTLEIKVQANGPLIFKGMACIQDTTQKEIFRKVGGLCRCGHSGNSPFCDGTHAKISFVAE